MQCDLHGLANRRIGSLRELLKIRFEIMEPERANRIHATPPQPGVFARQQCRNGLFRGLEWRADELVRHTNPLFDGDVAVDQREEEPPQIRLEDVIEVLECVLAHAR